MFLWICRSWQKVNSAAFYFGTAAIVPFSLLWIPVSRGSVLLRIVGIPFERAVRYHIWLANLMILLVTLHSIGYIVFYYYNGQAELVDIYIHMSQQEAIHSYAQNYQILYASFGHELVRSDSICIFWSCTFSDDRFYMHLLYQSIFHHVLDKSDSIRIFYTKASFTMYLSKSDSTCISYIKASFIMYL